MCKYCDKERLNENYTAELIAPRGEAEHRITFFSIIKEKGKWKLVQYSYLKDFIKTNQQDSFVSAIEISNCPWCGRYLPEVYDDSLDCAQEDY